MNAEPEIVTPPEKTSPEGARRLQAVADALTRVGDPADPQCVAHAVKVRTGLDLDPGEVALILRELREQPVPPPPEQPLPEVAEDRLEIVQLPELR
jgi:hypothetical protein